MRIAAFRQAIRVVLVDDHVLIVHGVKTILSGLSDIEVAGHAGDIDSAIELCASIDPDVAIVDLRLGDGAGVEFLRRVRLSGSRTRVIVLTHACDEQTVVAAVDAGVRGYVLKQGDPADIARAIRAVHAGQRFIAPEASLRLMERFSSSSLTEREIEVLQLVARGENNRAIAATLSIAEATVKGHLRHIFEKLNVKGRTEAVRVALRRGIIRLEEH